MESKVCSKCLTTQPVDAFHKKNGKARDWCKKCCSAYHREHYKKNKAKYVSAALQQREDLRAFIDSLKDFPCVDCGKKWPPEAMDFDHVSGTKVKDIASMVRFGSRTAIEEEVKKCELVCACCHRIRTKARLAGMA